MMISLEPYFKTVKRVETLRTFGKVSQVIGLIVEVTGLKAAVGEVCRIMVPTQDEYIAAEVVGLEFPHLANAFR